MSRLVIEKEIEDYNVHASFIFSKYDDVLTLSSVEFAADAENSLNTNRYLFQGYDKPTPETDAIIDEFISKIGQSAELETDKPAITLNNDTLISDVDILKISERYFPISISTSLGHSLLSLHTRDPLMQGSISVVNESGSDSWSAKSINKMRTLYGSHGSEYELIHARALDSLSMTTRGCVAGYVRGDYFKNKYQHDRLGYIKYIIPSSITSKLIPNCPSELEESYNIFHTEVVDNSFVTHRITLTKKYTIDNEIIISATERGYMKFGPDGRTAYRKLKRTDKEDSAFNALMISTKTLTHYVNADSGVYTTSTGVSLLNFFMDNMELAKKSGVHSMYDIVGQELHLSDSTIMIALAIMNDNPASELLINMGFSNLVMKTITKVINHSYNKQDMIANSNNLGHFINNEAKKGKQAVFMPPYIVSYLKENDYCVEDIHSWNDIYQLENLSKDNFEKIISMPEYDIITAFTTATLSKVCDIIKYDEYNAEKTIRYVVKQSIITGRTPNVIAGYLADYLRMCQDAEITADEFPKDIESVHDTMSEHMMTIRNELSDKKIRQHADSHLENLKPIFTSTDKDTVALLKKYSIIFPQSSKDLVEEGQQQRNCVGGYVQRVVDGTEIVFFIREKESESVSLATCSFQNREDGRAGYHQCMYRSNRSVGKTDDVYKLYSLVQTTLGFQE